MCGRVFRGGKLFTPGMGVEVHMDSGIKTLHWGIPKGSFEPYNARSERLYQFWKELSNNRGYFDVDAFVESNKTFGIRGQRTLLGGLFDENRNFVILTVPANEIVLPHHPRMPLVVNQDIDYFMHSEILDVERYKNPELSLFF